MDSYVTYLQITSAESGRASLLQLPPSPHVSPFSLYGCCFLQMQMGGSRLLYWGEPAPLPPRRGAAGSHPQYKSRSPPRSPPHLHLQQTTSIEEKKET